MNKRSKQRISDQRCENCGASGVQLRQVADVHDGILIENIPPYVCGRCGERYVTSATQQTIDLIRAEPARYTTEKKVPAAALA